MQLGCCVAPDQLATLAAAGGDYGELTVAGAVMGGDDDAFAGLLAQIAAAPIPVLAYNVFLPGDRQIVGPAVDRAWLDDYIRRALDRIARLTGPGALLVIGSGRSRSIPAGFDRATALDQLADFFDRLGPLARERGIVVALEHLRRAESNVFTSLRECGDFIRARGLADTHLLADLYHLMEEDEPLAVLDDYADLIVHTHIADSARHPPGTGTYPLAAFFDRLRTIGYTGHCSIECRWSDFPAEIGAAMAALRVVRREA